MKKIAILLGFCLVMATLPTFMPQPVAAMTGSGTVGDPYVIYNVTDLQNIQNDLSAYYVLNNSIDASDTTTWNWDAGRGVYEGFVPITTFAGHFDGNNCSISNVYINRAYTSTAYCGLFGRISGGATIDNVLVLDADITAYVTGSYAPYVGVLVGLAEDDVTQCHTSGTIAVNWTSGGAITNGVGGLVGRTATGVMIYRCSADVDVEYRDLSSSALMNAGGLIGYHNGYTATDCYARGSVYIYTGYMTTPPSAGGLVGRLVNAYVTRCYSTGYISGGFLTGRLGGLIGSNSGGITSASYWDLQTSGMAVSAGGTGKSTVQMKTQSTYSGWNFVSIWAIDGIVNDGYPYLFWWYNPPDIIQDVNQVVWFQPNAIIEGTELPNRAQGGTLQDGEFHWGANPAGITISHGELIPEEEYDFVPISPSSEDIIQPDPDVLTGDVDTAGLVNNPLYPGIHAIGEASNGKLTDRLVWLIGAWFILIAAMLFVHLGFDTKKGTEKPHHFVLTTIVGLGLSILFYTMGIFPLWVVIVLAFGFVGAIVYERQPVL